MYAGTCAPAFSERPRGADSRNHRLDNLTLAGLDFHCVFLGGREYERRKGLGAGPLNNMAE